MRGEGRRTLVVREWSGGDEEELRNWVYVVQAVEKSSSTSLLPLVSSSPGQLGRSEGDLPFL